MAEEIQRRSPNVNRSWRRISTGRLSFLYSEEKVLPNYLRSPTGSCHDACKYGRNLESQDKPRVSSLKRRANRSYFGTQSFDSSPLKKKASTKSMSNPSQDKNYSRRVCDDNMNNAKRTREKEVSLSEYRLAESSNRKKKKTVSSYFKAFGKSSGRALEMVEHNKRVTALKLKSVAQTAAMALRRSTVNRKKSIDGTNKALEPKRVSSKRCSRSFMKTRKESNGVVPLRKTKKVVNEKCEDLVGEKTLYVVKTKTEDDEPVESDQNQRCVEVADESSQEEFKVVLKHQDTKKKRGKKVVLFNKVIKETTSKLVETRKSKVKALVGAFESVISLQKKRFSTRT